MAKTIPRSRTPNGRSKSQSGRNSRAQIEEVGNALGSGAPRPSRWSNLRRHPYFGATQDLMDVVRLDWPDARAGLTDSRSSRGRVVRLNVVSGVRKQLDHHRARVLQQQNLKSLRPSLGDLGIILYGLQALAACATMAQPQTERELGARYVSPVKKNSSIEAK